MGLGSMNIHNYTVTIYDPQGLPLLQVWQDNTGAKIWRFALRPQSSTPSCTEEEVQAFTIVPDLGVKCSDLQAFSAYDIPIAEAIVRYFHAAMEFSFKSTWMDAIKAGNFASWPGLTYQNAAKYCPSSDETLKGHMEQTHQSVLSTKPKPPPTTQPSSKLQAHPDSPPALPTEITNEVHIWETPISKIYLDDTGIFPVRYCSGNWYVMIVFHYDSNTTLQDPFKTKPNKHLLATYNSI